MGIEKDRKDGNDPPEFMADSSNIEQIRHKVQVSGIFLKVKNIPLERRELFGAFSRFIVKFQGSRQKAPRHATKACRSLFGEGYPQTLR